MREKLNPLISQFIKFGLVGLSNTIISFSINYGIIFLGKYLQAPLSEGIIVFIASFAGFIISVLNSYYWNNKYVFKKTDTGFWKPLLKSYLCYGCTWIVSYLLAYLFSEYFNISQLMIPILSMVITIPLNFLMNKFWAFK